jgi:predicted deacylase
MKKTLHNIETCKLVNGYDLSLTLHEFTGNRPGPTLGLSSTIHGTTDLGIETFRRLSLELENFNFKGRVVMLPVANPLALGSFTIRTPIDMNDLMHCFPGSKQGEVSDQIADAIVREYTSQGDYFIDFCSGGTCLTEDYILTYPGSEELGKMTGWKYILMIANRPGTITEYLGTQNKPMVATECGGDGQNNEYYIQRGLTSIKNTMKYLKMIDGEPVLPEKQCLVKEVAFIKAKNGGIFKPCFFLDSMHSIVDKSTLLGITYSPYTFEEIEHFYGPFNQNIIMGLKAKIGKVEAGDYMFILGNGDTIEQL